LGTTYTHLCKFAEAEEYLEQALEIAENQFDSTSHNWTIRTTEILEKLGTMKRRKGDVNESLNLLTQCVELKNKHYFSINHPGQEIVCINLCMYVHTHVYTWVHINVHMFVCIYVAT